MICLISNSARLSFSQSKCFFGFPDVLRSDGHQHILPSTLHFNIFRCHGRNPYSTRRARTLPCRPFDCWLRRNRQGRNCQKGETVTNTYKKPAELITGLGFITLRVDKRGVGGSGGSYLETGMWDLVKNFESNIAFLENHPQVDPNKPTSVRLRYVPSSSSASFRPHRYQ